MELETRKLDRMFIFLFPFFWPWHDSMSTPLSVISRSLFD